MNCQEFEQIVSELADDRLASVRIRITAMTHAANCQHCYALLQAQKALNQSLLTVAEHSADQQAPLQLRQSLFAAFEAQQAELAAEQVSSSNVIRLADRKPFVGRRWVWVSAAAAAIVVFAAIVWAWQNPRPSERFVADTTITPTVTPGPPAKTTPPSNDGAAQTPHVISSMVVGRKGNRQLHKGMRKSTSDGNELAANYIPLSYAAGSATPDQSLVVRVNVPRTTLIAMGLPLNAERGSEMIKADLRVGIDGVPLAIRLIRQ